MQPCPTMPYHAHCKQGIQTQTSLIHRLFSPIIEPSKWLLIARILPSPTELGGGLGNIFKSQRTPPSSFHCLPRISTSTFPLVTSLPAVWNTKQNLHSCNKKFVHQMTLLLLSQFLLPARFRVPGCLRASANTLVGLKHTVQ
jgi:hypothetical protein